jgi:hypothetical protein
MKVDKSELCSQASEVADVIETLWVFIAGYHD